MALGVPLASVRPKGAQRQGGPGDGDRFLRRLAHQQPSSFVEPMGSREMDGLEPTVLIDPAPERAEHDVPGGIQDNRKNENPEGE